MVFDNWIRIFICFVAGVDYNNCRFLFPKFAICLINYSFEKKINQKSFTSALHKIGVFQNSHTILSLMIELTWNVLQLLRLILMSLLFFSSIERVLRVYSMFSVCFSCKSFLHFFLNALERVRWNDIRPVNS